jgi:hypothetical protein
MLGNGSCVSVILEKHGAAERLPENVHDGNIDPGGQVGCTG